MGSGFARRDQARDVVPEKPDEKSKNPEGQRRYNKKKKRSAPTRRLFSSALSHLGLGVPSPFPLPEGEGERKIGER